MTFTTDIDDLIRLGRGDVKRLRNIRETIKHDNFIPTVDKKYIESLISTYLKNQSIDESYVQQELNNNLESETELNPNQKSTELKPIQKSTDTQSSILGGSNNKEIGILAGAAAAIALIVVLGFSVSSMNQIEILDESNIQTSTTQKLSISVDESSYKTADIISITGNVKSNTENMVEVFIKNANGKKIWNEYIHPKSNGDFSTLLIAGGNELLTISNPLTSSFSHGVPPSFIIH